MSEIEKLIREHVRGEYTGDCAGMDDVTLYGVDAAAKAIEAAIQSQARRVEEREGALRKIIATIRAMDDEYNLDNECDYTKINEFIEVLADLADLSEGSGSSRELAPPDESGDACGATERAE